MSEYTAAQPGVVHYDTGVTLYARFFERRGTQVWDTSVGAMTESPASYGVTCIGCDECTTGRVYRIVAPSALPEGIYDVYVYQQLGASAANTDTYITAIEYRRYGA